jgi:hypothetical protein
MKTELALIAVMAVFLTSCGGSDPSPNSSNSTPSTNQGASPNTTPTPTATPVPTRNATISWAPNREKAVNQAGGGYKVYFSTTSGFSVPSTNVVDAPYSSGPLAPTQATLPGLNRGARYYIKVIAYSALIPPGSSTGATSSPSAELAIDSP